MWLHTLEGNVALFCDNWSRVVAISNENICFVGFVLVSFCLSPVAIATLRQHKLHRERFRNSLDPIMKFSWHRRRQSFSIAGQLVSSAAGWLAKRNTFRWMKWTSCSCFCPIFGQCDVRKGRLRNFSLISFQCLSSRFEAKRFMTARTTLHRRVVCSS